MYTVDISIKLFQTSVAVCDIRDWKYFYILINKTHEIINFESELSFAILKDSEFKKHQFPEERHRQVAEKKEP